MLVAATVACEGRPQARVPAEPLAPLEAVTQVETAPLRRGSITQRIAAPGIAGEYDLEAIGPTTRLRETIAAIGFAFTIGLVAMYMILAAQFNSFVHPLRSC